MYPQCAKRVSRKFKTPWRFIGSLISQKYPTYDIIVQEPWVGESLDYYLNKDIKYLNKKLLNKTKQSIFLCRPLRCDKLKDIQVKLRILDTKTINWGRNKEKTIHIYFLEKRNDCLLLEKDNEFKKIY